MSAPSECKNLLAGLLVISLTMSVVLNADIPTNASQPVVITEFPMWEQFDDFFNTNFVVSEDVNLFSSNGNVITRVDAGTLVELWSLDPHSFSRVRVGERMGYVHSYFIVAEWEYREMVRVATGEFIYPIRPDHVTNVELLPWSDIRTIWRAGTIAQITDVRTGLTYSVRNMGNGNHSDVETVTQMDTNIMRRTYGGVWSWATRPIIVSVNGRHIAASINGMPHAGATIIGNGMAGHVCIHFQGSRTHNGNQRHTQDHQNAVMEAFNVWGN